MNMQTVPPGVILFVGSMLGLYWGKKYDSGAFMAAFFTLGWMSLAVLSWQP